MTARLQPLKFKPVYKDYIWGGNRIPATFNRPMPAGIYAESWEISDHDDGMSVVGGGPFAGRTLRELLKEHGPAILGSRVSGSKFPLLIKLIDAREKLSVQVHPNDATAAKYGGEAKTEMWYLLGDNETRIYCGLKPGTTKASFLRAVASGTSGDTLRSVPVRKGSAAFVPGGRIHAIDAGCLILEIQQNSNTTYRLYDWDRVGADGKPRPLHIEQAVQVIDWNDHADPLVEPVLRTDANGLLLWDILKCDYFHLEKLVFTAPVETPLDGTTFHALFVAEGSATIRWDGGEEPVVAGESILIPAALSRYIMEGEATVLRTTVPKKPH